ncbi:MAG: hypothetical protein JXA04_00630 [Gammaproteobacteria bacterium]|nr:hypothetical protein [Gammaproteobacteria bacterium]
MPVMLFKLNGVPDDEADEIRALLSQNDIPYYETSAGNWRISLAAIWLNDEDCFDQAKKLIEEYQTKRSTQAQQEYSQSEAEGNNLSFLNRFLQEPFRYILYLLVVLIIIYFSTIPFLYFSDWLGGGVK